MEKTLIIDPDNDSAIVSMRQVTEFPDNETLLAIQIAAQEVLLSAGLPCAFNLTTHYDCIADKKYVCTRLSKHEFASS